MKEPNANGNGKSLAFNGWGFRILLFTAQKPSEDSRNSIVFRIGDEGSVFLKGSVHSEFLIFAITKLYFSE